MKTELTEKAKKDRAAESGKFAYLRVKNVTPAGAFLEGDIPVPFHELGGRMEKGRKYVVRVFTDRKSGRLIASTRIGRFIEKEATDLKEGEEVDLFIDRFTNLGALAIVNDRFLGMIYKNEIFRDLRVGDKIKGFVRKIREDGKVDLSLRKGGYGDVEEAREVILGKLKKSKGRLPLSDSSSPELIKDMLQMSKKTFKKAIGGLYKDRVIEIEEDGIRLKSVETPKPAAPKPDRRRHPSRFVKRKRS